MGEAGEIRYESLTTKVAVVLGVGAFAAIKGQALAAGGKETGGILIGRYDATGDIAIVSEATTSPRDSRAGWSWFQRGASGLKELLRKRWGRGDYYLGEWHSHPGAPPDPSSNDVNEMRAIARDPRYECPKPIMIIAGTPFRTVRLSVNVFDGGRLLSLQRRLDEPRPEPRPLSAADAGSITTTIEIAKHVTDGSDFHGTW